MSRSVFTRADSPDVFYRRATLAPPSWDPETRKGVVVWGTETRVQRRDAAGVFDEVLSLAHVDLSGLRSVFVDHQLNARSRAGSVPRAWVEVENGQGLAEIKLSSRDDLAWLRQAIAEGDPPEISIGYRVSKWADSTDSQGRRIRTAVRWAVFEISFVGVAADPATGFRSSDMDPEEMTTPEAPATEQPNATAQRNAAIRVLCRNMPREFTDSLIDNPDLDLIQARAAVNAEMQRRVVPIRAHVVQQLDSPAQVLQRQIGGFVAAATGATPADHEREFAGLSFVRHLEEMLIRRGENTRRMGEGEIVQRAFGTHDAPEFFLGVGNRVVEATYPKALHPIMGLTVTRSVPDYRPVSFLRDSDFDGELEPIGEHGEFTRTGFSESKITGQVEDFARGFDVTEKAVRNDDKGVLVRVPERFARMAADKEAALVLGVLAANPVMDDGEDLFSVAHGNFDASNNPISLQSVSDGRLAMRSLRGLAGEQLNIAPRFLVVSPELETVGEQFLAALQPTSIGDVQPIRLQLIVEPGLPSYQWLLAADPATAPCLTMLRLTGGETPRIEQSAAWNTFAMQFRCKHTVNAVATGWRGLHMFEDGQPSES